MGRRWEACWRLKLALTVTLNLVFWPSYSYLGHHALFPIRSLPTVWLDETIPFQPTSWSWVYLSQFLFTGILPWLLPNREAIRRYVVGFALITLVSFGVFLFFPTVGPRPAGAEGPSAFAFIVALDGPLNAFPSLHAAFLIYHVLLARRLWPGSPLLVAGVALFWGGAILYATVATRQHYVVDLAAGGILGGLANWLAGELPAGGRAASTTSRNSGSASSTGSR